MFRIPAMSLRENIRYWIPVAFWIGFIFWMSTDTFSSQHTSPVIDAAVHFLTQKISSQGMDTINELIRKCAHLTEYFILGLLLFRAFHLNSTGPVWRSAFFAMGIVVLYAASDEFHQSFVSSRTASIIDVGIDSVGGIIAQFASVLWWKRKKPGTDNKTSRKKICERP